MFIASDVSATAAKDIFGRASEISAITDLLRADADALVTITGIGGIGKSTLARALAASVTRDYPGGVISISIRGPMQPGELCREVGYALGGDGSNLELHNAIDVCAALGTSLLVVDGLDDQSALADLAALRLEWPGLQVLVAARRPLRLPGEQVYILGPLPVSPWNEGPSPAAALFLDRWAQSEGAKWQKRPDLELVEDICRSLDGIPLAIELAAGWSRLLTAEEIRDNVSTRIDRLIDHPTGSDTPRATLNEALAWSYERLTPDQQLLFQRLSPFVGGFTLDFADRVIAGHEAGAPYPYADAFGIPFAPAEFTGRQLPLEPWDGPSLRSLKLAPLALDPVTSLAALLDLGLIQRLDPVDSESRYRLLDPVREFALARLSEADQVDAVFHQHAKVIVSFWEAAVEGLYHADRARFSRERMERGVPNFRAALSWLLNQGDAGTELAQRLAGCTWIFWQQTGRIDEGRSWMQRAFANDQNTWPAAVSLPALGLLTWIQGDDAGAELILNRSIQISAEYGLNASEGSAWLYLACVAWRKMPADLNLMLAHLGRAMDLLRPSHEETALGICCQLYGVVAQEQGDSKRALEYQNEALDIFNNCGFEWGIASAVLFSGTLMLIDPEAPREIKAEGVGRLAEAYGRYSEMHDLWGIGGATAMFGAIGLQTGQTEIGGQLIGAAQEALDRGKSFLPPLYEEVVTQASTGLATAIGENGAVALLNQGATWTAEERDDAIGTLLTILMADPETTSEPEPVPAPSTARLTNHQLEIVRLLAEGLKPPQVAQRLNRHVSSVYETLERIQARLGVNKWEQIVPTARQNHLLEP